MKLIKIASGKTKIKISKQEWINIGKQAAWYHEPETDKYAGKGTFDITVYLDKNEVYQPSTPDSPEGIKATAIYTYYPPEKSTSSYPGYPEHIQRAYQQSPERIATVWMQLLEDCFEVILP